MEFIQEEINNHKVKLMNLINTLISTQSINEEIFINSEIKKESELLNSLLNIKQKEVLNQMYQINQMNQNINLNPFMPQPNLMMNAPLMNDKDEILNVRFHQIYGDVQWIILCNKNEKICDVIKKYRQKANDFNDNDFIYNNERLNIFSNSTLSELSYKNNDKILVSKRGWLNSSINEI